MIERRSWTKNELKESVVNLGHVVGCRKGHNQMIDARTDSYMGHMTPTPQSNAKNACVLGEEEARNVKKKERWQTLCQDSDLSICTV